MYTFCFSLYPPKKYRYYVYLKMMFFLRTFLNRWTAWIEKKTITKLKLQEIMFICMMLCLRKSLPFFPFSLRYRIYPWRYWNTNDFSFIEIKQKKKEENFRRKKSVRVEHKKKLTDLKTHSHARKNLSHVKLNLIINRLTFHLCRFYINREWKKVGLFKGKVSLFVST